MPIAVRLGILSPEDMVLKAGDLPPGFRVSADFATLSLGLTAPVWGSPNHARSSGGSTGHSAVLVRDAGPGSDGVVSIATTAVGYETAASARTDFERVVEPAPGPTVRHHGGSASSHSARYRIGSALIEEVVLLVRNYIVVLSAVRYAASPSTSASTDYTELMRSKLADL